MSAANLPRPIIVGILLFLALYAVMSCILGPGIADYSQPIIGGYLYNDVGGYEKTISYKAADSEETTIVDARVDGYKIIGDHILVARKPRELKLINNDIFVSHLLSICEYWIIDVKVHSVKRIEGFNDLKCKS